MVLRLCPFCAQEVELDDKAVGLFCCPHCDEDFEGGGSSEGFADVAEAFVRSFVMTTIVFFFLSILTFFYEGYQIDEALGWTLIVAVIAPVWIPLAFVPFFIQRGYLFIQRLRKTG
jgi:hypothetical protein